MAGPLIYVGTHAIKRGRQEDAKTGSRALVEFLEANHGRVLHFEIFIDGDASEMTVIQIHPDEDSLRDHLRLAGEKIAQAYEFLDSTTRIDIYGTPSPALVDTLTQMGIGMGAPIRFQAAAAGFTRLTPVAV